MLKNICKKIPEPIITLIAFVKIIMYGFAFVGLLYGLLINWEYGPIFVPMIIFSIIIGAIGSWFDD